MRIFCSNWQGSQIKFSSKCILTFGWLLNGGILVLCTKMVDDKIWHESSTNCVTLKSGEWWRSSHCELWGYYQIMLFGHFQGPLTSIYLIYVFHVILVYFTSSASKFVAPLFLNKLSYQVMTQNPWFHCMTPATKPTWFCHENQWLHHQNSMFPPF